MRWSRRSLLPPALSNTTSLIGTRRHCCAARGLTWTTCLWTPDASTSHNITLNGQVVGFYRAEVQHFTCDTGLHRGEADITLTASNAGCHLGSFHFEFDVNGMTAQVSGPPDPSGTIGTLSCINGTTLEFDGNEVQGSAAYCTEMTSVSWFQSWPNIQIGSQCRPL